jgi:hypothetical protein
VAVEVQGDGLELAVWDMGEHAPGRVGVLVVCAVELNHQGAA